MIQHFFILKLIEKLLVLFLKYLLKNNPLLSIIQFVCHKEICKALRKRSQKYLAVEETITSFFLNFGKCGRRQDDILENKRGTRGSRWVG